MLAAVDWHGLVPDAAPQEGAVTPDFQIGGSSQRSPDLDAQGGEAWSQGLGALVRQLLTVSLAFALRATFCFRQLGPGRGQLALPLVAQGHRQ